MRWYQLPHQPHFVDELDFCLALDVNKPSPQENRTEIGELEYQAKYHQVASAVSQLVTQMAQATRWLPLKHIPKPRLLTYVPSSNSSPNSLASQLARGATQSLPAGFWGGENPLVIARLKSIKESAKNLAVAAKIDQWGEIVRSGGIALSRPVEDCSVIVLDDLYQSGVSLWSFAKYLKARKARIVVGLVCVKSLRDTDNR